MTIAVSVKVGEGLVMAADSMSSYFNEGVLAQSYSHARKLMQLSDYPIGILTYGLGDIAGRNLESLVAEFERTLPTSADRSGYSVRDVTDDLHRFIQQKYEAVFPAPAQLPLEPAEPDAPERPPLPAATLPDSRPRLGVVVGGYSHDDFFPDEFEFMLPAPPPTEIWPDHGEGQQQFGVRWWGQTGPVERLYLGCDTDAISWFIENGIPEADALQYYSQLRDRLMWPIIYQGMPIQDAIDLAVYLINVTIGHSRFAVGPPVRWTH